MKHITLVLFLLSSLAMMSQVPSSLSIGSNSGIDRIHLNPGLGTHSLYSWDATIAGANLFAQTDYGLVRNATLLNLIGQLRDADVIDSQAEIPEQSDRPLIIFDEDGGGKQMFLRGRINGPSFSVALKSNVRVGMYSSFRAHLSSNNIPENFGIYELNESYRTNIVDIDRGSISGATWIEIGGHLSKEIEGGSFGFNIKYLRASEGGYINSNVDEDYDFVDSILTVNAMSDFETAFTTSTINSGDFLPDANGSGIGVDLGGVVQLENLTLGASIMDIGVIQFKSNVEIYTREILADITEIRTQDFRNFTSVRSLIDQFQNDLDITPDVFGVFSVGLPTRISLFGDYRYDNNIFISANINQRLPIFGNSLLSNNTVVITPRYETSLYSLFLPITVHEYESLRIGAAFRVGPFTIGTDHLSSVLIPSDFRGSDVFFSLNLYPFNSQDRTRGGKGRGVLCPMF